MRFVALVITAALAATPAVAQSWGSSHDGYSVRRSNAVPSNFDWRSQLDRPGDYRCDQFWDADRSDCGAGWRDQRHRVSPQARQDYRAVAGYSRDGYGYGYGRLDGDRYGHGSQGYGYSSSHRGYGSAYGHAQGSTTWNGAYGRPDHVYPGGGYRSAGHGGSRADWCRATYRSYDPHSGYYRAYSGRLIFCG